jgi:ankyrin repeat protein
MLLYLPNEIIIMIIENLYAQDAERLCEALCIPDWLAFRYGHCPKGFVLSESPYDFTDYYQWESYFLSNQDGRSYIKEFLFFYYHLRKKETGKNTDHGLAFFQNPNFNNFYSASEKLIIAVVLGYVDQIKLFLQDDITLLDLHCAFLEASKGDVEIMKLILDDKRYDPSCFDNESIISASAHGFYDAIKLLLLDKRVDPAAQSNQAIISASQIYGNTECVKLLLSNNKVDPSAQDNQAFIEACYAGNLETVKLLLADPRIDPAAQCDQGFIEACYGGNTEVVKCLLLDSRINPTAQFQSGLVYAAENGRYSTLEILLQNKRIDPCAQNNKALMRAAKFGRTHCMKLLLRDPRVSISVKNSWLI